MIRGLLISILLLGWAAVPAPCAEVRPASRPPARSPEDPASGLSGFCGTPGLLTSRTLDAGLAPDRGRLRTLASLLGDGRLADTLCPSWIESGHFRIHYATSGADRIAGWPDTAYRDSIAQDLEHAYEVFHERLDFPVPPGDGEAGGGADRIDCYVHTLGQFHAAQAVPESSPSGSCPASCTGYIEVSPGLAPGPDLRGVLAHEYFHLVQYGISSDQDLWFEETTAMWAMHVAWPGDPGYMADLPQWFATPYLPLATEEGGHEYGSVHYWLLLEETRGPDFLSRLWRRCCREAWETALDTLLVEQGSSFDESLVQLALWCNATGTEDDGLHFREARLFPEIRLQAEHRVYPVTDATVPYLFLAQAGGSNYIRFYGPGDRDTLRIEVDGHADLSASRRISIVATQGGRHSEWSLAPDSTGSVSFAVPGWSLCDEVTLIVTNFVEAQGHMQYRYSARETGPVAPVSLLDLQCLPNPAHGRMTISFRGRGEAQAAAIEIFDAAGVRVRSYPLGWTRPGSMEVDWDGRDRDDRRLPSGVYWVRARFGPASVVRKVLLVE